MRKQAHTFSHQLTRFVVAALLCIFAVNTVAAEVEPTPIQAEVALLEDMAETQQDESLVQLVQLLQKLPTNAAPDDRREALVATIAMYIKVGQLTEATKLNLELGALASKNRDDRASAMALSYQASFLHNEGKLDDATKIIEQSLLIAQHVNEKKLISRVNSTAATIYQDLGNFKAALQHQLIAMDALEEGNRHAELRRIGAMNNIATIYLDLKDPQLSLDYNDKATKLAQSLDAQNMLATLEINRGIAYSDLNKLDDATKAYLRALKISRKIADRRSEAVALNNLSDVSLALGHYSACVQFAEQTIDLAHTQEDKALEATGLANIGLCHMNLGSIAQGAAEANRAIDFFRDSKEKPSAEEVLGQLSSAYENVKMYKEALKAMQEQRSLTAELFRKDRDRALSEMKAKFDASQREKQIEVLEQKNQVQSVELKNKSLQRVVAILATLVAGAVALIIAALYRKVRESNRELQETNIKLEQQSTRDPLTGLLNRRAFQDMMKFRAQMAERRLSDPITPPHALVLLDIDHFKLINDTHGHSTGDLVLINISKHLQQIMREKDMLMRWGGEEFLIFLNHIPVENLTPVIERVLKTVAEATITEDGRSISVSTSIGYISLPQAGTSTVDLNWEKALHLADTALYMAKTRGRNQAIGISAMDISPNDFTKLVQGNLEDAIAQGLVQIQQIFGPVITHSVPAPESVPSDAVPA
jgi:diguanylate cyclase (GGDEF)-like protein